MVNMAPVIPGFLTIQRFAEHFEISTWTAREWCLRGRVASVKIGRKILIPASELRRLVDDNTRPAVQS